MMPARELHYLFFGSMLLYCAVRMVQNNRNKRKHAVPDASPLRLNENPGADSPELYTDLGNVYLTRERRYRIACIIIAILWFLGDQLLVNQVR